MVMVLFPVLAPTDAVYVKVALHEVGLGVHDTDAGVTVTPEEVVEVIVTACGLAPGVMLSVTVFVTDEPRFTATSVGGTNV